MPLVMIKSDVRAREKPCLKCGYSLRKIDSNHCPECGLSVWLSLNQNDTLDMSNPEWLRRMARGLWVLAVASVLAVIACAPASLQTFRTMQYRQRLHQAMLEAADDDAKWATIVRSITRPKPDYQVVRLTALVGAAALVAYEAGLLILTSNENRYPDRLAGLRVGARVIAGAAGLAVLLMFLQILRPTPLGFPEWMTRLVAVAGGSLTWEYLRQMARRLPHKTLTRVCAWMTLVPLISLAYSFIRNSDWLPDVIPLVYLPVSAALFVRFAILLRQAARTSDRNWAAETVTTR
jgi:hypothetical protein